MDPDRVAGHAQPCRRPADLPDARGRAARLHAPDDARLPQLPGLHRALEPAPAAPPGDAAGVDRGRCHAGPRISRAPRGAALARRRARTGRTGRAAAEHPDGSGATALGVHVDRRAGTPPLRAVREDAPFADRRHQRHAAAAAGDVDRPREEPVAAALLVCCEGPAGVGPPPGGRADDGCRDGVGRAVAAQPAALGAAAGRSLRQDPAPCRRARRGHGPAFRCAAVGAERHAYARSAASPRSRSRWSDCARWPALPAAR